MIWDEKKQNKEILNLYKKLIKIRKKNKALIHGTFEVVYCKEEVMGFIREYCNDKILVIFNNSEKDHYIKCDNKENGVNLITGESVDFLDKIKIKPLDFMIIKF